MRKLFDIGLEEDLDMDLDIETEDEENPEEMAEDFEDDADLADNDSDELEEMPAIENAFINLEGLENLVATVESFEDGLTPQSAQLMALTVPTALRSMGFPKEMCDNSMPSLEDFGGTNTQVEATGVAVEGWKESIEKGWKAVKDFVLRVIKTSKEFVERLIDGAKRLKANADKIGKAIEQAQKDKYVPKSDDRTFESKSVTGTYMSSQKVLKVSEVLDSVAAHESILEVPTKLSGPISTFMADNARVKADVKTKEEAETESKNLIDATKKFVDAASGALKNVMTDSSGPASEVRKIMPVTKGRTLVVDFVQTNKNPDDVLSTLEFMSISVVSITSKSAVVSPLVELAKLSDLAKVVDAVKKLSDKAIKVKGESSKQMSAFSKEADNAIKNAIKTLSNDDTDARELMTKRRRVVMGLTKTFDGVYRRMPGLAIVGGQAALAYTAASLAQYKKPKADDKSKK